MLISNPPNRNKNHQLPIFWTTYCVDQESGTRLNPTKYNSEHLLARPHRRFRSAIVAHVIAGGAIGRRDCHLTGAAGNRGAKTGNHDAAQQRLLQRRDCHAFLLPVQYFATTGPPNL
ncbi:MAG: hypothetical protein ACI9P3_000669 [Bradyrhizobium sp.]|jgi:hypothetical protein